MGCVRMPDDNVETTHDPSLLHAVPGGFDRAVHTVPTEIGIAQRCVYKNVARCDRRENIGEIKRKLIQPTLPRSEARHVARLTPALAGTPQVGIATLVVHKRIKPAARHHRTNAFIRGGCEEPVVAAERMSDAAEPVGPDRRNRCQQVEPADVVPYRLPRTTDVSQGRQIRRVVGDQRVGGREHNETALNEFDPIFVVRRLAQAHHHATARSMGLVQGEDRRERACNAREQRRFWQEKKRRNATARLALIGEIATEIIAAIYLLLHPDIEIAAAGQRRNGPHDPVHRRKNALPQPRRFGVGGKQHRPKQSQAGENRCDEVDRSATG